MKPERISQLVGVAAAVVVAVLLNVLVARHFTRWDWTTSKRHSLSPATLQTLHELSEPIEVWVLLGPADPIEQSVKQLLVSYQAETTKLEIHYVDPDRDVLQVEDVKKRFKIETGRTEEGHVVADAIVVIAKGQRHWFLGTTDMIEVQSGDDTRVKPREERALTGAIRSVLVSEKSKICFTSGHGEMSPDDPGAEGAGMLKDVLSKDNYELKVIDTSAPNAIAPFDGCGVAVIAGLRGAFTKDETERLRTYLVGGGNLLLAASPITASSETGMTGTNLDRALSPFGIALDDDLVIEDDADSVFPGTGGIRFVGQARPHAITAGLIPARGSGGGPRKATSRSVRARSFISRGRCAAPRSRAARTRPISFSPRTSHSA